jgi:predicted ATPase
LPLGAILKGVLKGESPGLTVWGHPEFQPPWTDQPQVSVLALNRLDRRDRTALVEQIADGKALPDEVIAQITDRTDGVPLFFEELD